MSTDHRTTTTRNRALRARRRAGVPLAARLRGERGAHAEFLADGGPLRATRRRDRAYRAGLLCGDVAAALVVVALVRLLLPAAHLGGTGLLLALLVPLVNRLNGLYERDTRLVNKNTLDEAPTIFRAATITTVAGYILSSAILLHPIAAKVVALVWAGLTVAVPACRVAGRAVVRRVLPPERCLVVGDHPQGRRLAEKLDSDSPVDSELVGVVPLERAAPGADPATSVSALSQTVERLDVHRVFVAAGTDNPQEELEIIQAAKAVGVKVSVLPRVLEVVGSAASYDYVDGFTILGIPRFGLSRPTELAKRAFDVLASALLVLLISPALGAIAAAIKLTSRGPVFFRQRRIGRDGQAFSMLKFRSMHEGADRLKDSLREHNEQDGGLFKIADDPRITPFGRFLRRTSLDELPQILNVLRGEMSLVGPRPLVPEEDRMIQGWHRRRLHLTPGMTGPWQVLGSSRIPLQEMVTIDYLYVANWSVWNDVKILLRTVGTVLERRGR
jgi:exopolysaccharide biosynthesis polyprenyl glycosylphosphotransferase